MTDAAERPARVMIVDDNPVVRSGLKSLLEADGTGEVVAEMANGEQAVSDVDSVQPDVVLLDVRMPGVDGVEVAGLLSPKTHVLMLTYTDDPEVVRSAIRNGACGYLVHGMFTPEELERAIRDAMSGASPLSPTAASALLSVVREDPPRGETPSADQSAARSAMGLSTREAEIVELIAQGHSNAGIAEQLFLSEKTVKNHLNRIYAKLSVDSRTAAVARWHASGA